MRSTNKGMTELGDRINFVENKMGDFTSAYSELVDAHFEVEDVLKSLRLKVADLKDRLHRNNITFRGIPEQIKQADLRPPSSSNSWSKFSHPSRLQMSSLIGPTCCLNNSISMREYPEMS